MAVDSAAERQSAYQDVVSEGGFPVLFRRSVFTDRVKTGTIESYGVAIEIALKEPVASNNQGLMVSLLVPAVKTDASGADTGEALDIREPDEVEYLGRRAVIADAGRVAPVGEPIIYTPVIQITRDSA